MKFATVGFLLILFAYNVFAGSEFSSESLEAACRSYLRKNAPAGAQIEILQKIKPEAFGSDGVRAKCRGEAFEGLGRVEIEFQQGGEVIKTISVAAKVKSSSKAPEIIVKRGDRIALEVRSGAITVRTESIALEAGALGEWIKVKRESGAIETLRARVTGPGVALIECQ